MCLCVSVCVCVCLCASVHVRECWVVMFGLAYPGLGCAMLLGCSRRVQIEKSARNKVQVTINGVVCNHWEKAAVPFGVRWVWGAGPGPWVWVCALGVCAPRQYNCTACMYVRATETLLFYSFAVL